MSVIPRKTVFSAHGLTKVYTMGAVKVHALRGIDLDLYEGELVVFLGASGSGKSTLLNILGGLDTASAGEVLYCGDSLTQASEKQLTQFRRNHVGFVFQFYNLIPSLTAEENIAVVTELVENPLSAQDALKLVGLEKRGQHFPAQLSGGE
ncbi:MAG: ATP-binding cassette domain-containing protein, partial [Pseudomonadales bacterium]|nr:ATP-binding cassette domain-containing protein [Pseudomonadales bacterium]